MKYAVCARCYHRVCVDLGNDAARFWITILHSCEEEGGGVFEFCGESERTVRLLENHGILISTEMNHYCRVYVQMNGLFEDGDDFLGVCFYDGDH